MANLSITRRCGRECGFCFARLERGRGAVPDMPRDVFERALDFLRRSGVSDVRLLGGEPTEHPAFAEYAARALDLGFALTVFTGGLVPARALDCLRAIPPDRLRVVLNTAEAGVDPAPWVDARDRLCDALGPRVELGLTCASPGRDPSFLLRLIEAHGLRRRVRLGMAHPTRGGGNDWLRLQAARALGRTLEGFVRAAERAGVEVGFDCGFTPCQFSEEFLTARPAIRDAVGTRCGSVIDLLPEGVAIACYALSEGPRLDLTDDVTREELAAAFDREIEGGLPLGVSRECAFCTHRAEGRCNGGCRARRALRLRPERPGLAGAARGAP